MAVGRTDSMQQLITDLEKTFGETIIGSDINLIKHLFYYLQFEEVEFIFEYKDRYMTTKVRDVGMEFVELEVLGFEESDTHRAKIKFEVVNVMYTFEVVIEETRGSLVTIKIPTELQSAEMRHYRRVVVDDLFMSFVIQFKSYKGGKFVSGDNINAERRFNYLFREIKKDMPDLKLLNIIITDYVRSISEDYELVIYRPGDGNDFIRSVLSTDNRTVFIPECSDIQSYIGRSENLYYKNFYQIFKEMAKTSDEYAAGKFFEKMQKAEIRNFMVSYIIAPITLFDNVIGHLKVFTTAMDKKILGSYHAEFIHELTEIASYGFTKIAIRKDNINTTYVDTRIVDISISGLLFEVSDESLYNYLKKHNSIKMNIPIPGKTTLVITGEIVRFSVAEDNSFKLGVNFISSNPDDMKILEQYIYERRGNILSE